MKLVKLRVGTYLFTKADTSPMAVGKMMGVGNCDT